MASCPVETFPALNALSFLRAVFIQRCPGIDVKVDRETALERLADIHRQTKDESGFGGMPLVTAEQVHGKAIAIIDNPISSQPFSQTDGMVTTLRGVCLGIYVADCAAVFLADKYGKAIGVVHSGKKGTELGIVPEAIAIMIGRYGCRPEDLIVQISPCIRPPHYEIDIAGTIIGQAREIGVKDVQDCGTCTASDPARYYSYRREKGQTGRLLALMAMV